MDPNLELYRSILDLPPWEIRERMGHLSESEHDRVRSIIQRENDDRRLQESIAGRDLIQAALNDPSHIMQNTQLRYTVLGRTIHYDDEATMVKRITNQVAENGEILISRMADFDRDASPFCLDAWKLVYCDVCFIDGDSAVLQNVYETRVREEELQTPAERARELMRWDELRQARINAKWMIPAIERASAAEEHVQSDPVTDQVPQEPIQQPQGKEIMERLLEQQAYRHVLQRFWKQVSPAPPAWVQNIIDCQEQWGFVYYVSREVIKKYGHHWKSFWGQINNTGPPNRASYATIHCQGNDNWGVLTRLATENWPVFHPDETLAEDDDLRRHFKDYITNNRSLTKEDKKKKKRKRKDKDANGDALSPGILRNTFIVIPLEIISGNRNCTESDLIDPCWVWAYDADWDSSEEETVIDGEKYQGRVKVAKWSLEAWFYAARWEGVSLKDMWLKAQQHQDKFWICYTKRLEEWDHEPYT